MNIEAFINELIKTSNAYNTDDYLEHYHKDAVLDDPSVGRMFKGHSGIRKYFEEYFIGYKTKTRLLKLDITTDTSAYIEVEFTGEFPGGKTKGMFDFKFDDGKIVSVRADLI